MKKTLFSIFFLLPFFLFSQYDIYTKFKKTEIIEDLNFIKTKILNSHYNPYSYLSEDAFNKQFTDIETHLNEKTTIDEFQKLVYPIFVNLNDDHVYVSKFFTSRTVIPLDFKYYDNKFIVTDNFSSQNLEKGDVLISVNNINIENLIEKCSDYYLGDRTFKKQWTYNQFLYIIQNKCLVTDEYNLKFASGKNLVFDKKSTKKDLPQYRINYQLDEIEKGANQNIKYTKIDDKNGYIQANSFSIKGRTYIEWQKNVDRIFDQIKEDKIENLYIDVSKNSGGSAGVGNLLIYRFSDKKYKGFTFDTRKSDDYKEQYKNFDRIDSTNKKIIFPENIQNRFKGKTYIIIGQKTFSAAVLFATTVLDNQLATIIGETLEKGHPNHLGGVLSFETPHTKLKFSFSSMSSKRPDETKPNQLIPDIEIDLTNKKIEDIISFVEHYSSQKKREQSPK